jgi:hypothetical protein
MGILAWESFHGRRQRSALSPKFKEEVGHGGKEKGCEEEGCEEEEVAVRFLFVCPIGT